MTGCSGLDWDHILAHVKKYKGPLLFNVFINDSFYFVNQAVIYNYADVNTLSFIHHNLEVLINVLEDESCILIDRFCFCFFVVFFFVVVVVFVLRIL